MANNPLSQIPISYHIPKGELIDLLKQAIEEVLNNRETPKQETKDTEQPITQKELCTFLNVTEQTIIRYKKNKKIPFYQIGSSVRFNLSAVLKALGK